MKRKIRFIITIFICISLFAGCATKEALPESVSSYKDEKDISSSASLENQTNATSIEDSFRIYTHMTDSFNAFDKEISENQIDKDYKSSFDQATTTQEFVDVENEYINKWKDEMQNSIDQLGTIINENDYIDFENAQQEWEKQLLETTSSDYNIIKNNEYGIRTGSTFRWMWLENILEQYRERTIHIKYLIYILQI